MSTDFEIFSNKKFSDLLKDIYDNSRKKDRQINLLISELKPLVKSTNDASLIVPLIKEYLEVGVKNDEHLVKLAAIVQRVMSSSPAASDDGYIISEEEKKQILEAIESVSTETNNNTIPERNV
jgi:hypothetical protein